MQPLVLCCGVHSALLYCTAVQTSSKYSIWPKYCIPPCEQTAEVINMGNGFRLEDKGGWFLFMWSKLIHI